MLRTKEGSSSTTYAAMNDHTDTFLLGKPFSYVCVLPVSVLAMSVCYLYLFNVELMLCKKM
jgi:hypothetical protein